MTEQKKAPAGAPALTLLELLRDAQLYLVFQALVAGQVTKMTFPGALPYWTFQLAGDDVVVDDEQLVAIIGTLQRVTGRQRLKLAEKRGPRGAPFVALRIPDAVQEAVVKEAFALLAHLSADDLRSVPPPLDVQAA